MEVFTIGFAQKSAAEFFGNLRQAGVKRLVDVRLYNVSQLAGFTKRDDLAYFVKELCGAEYVHEPLLAPTPGLFDAYKKHNGCWVEYERAFLQLMADRRIESRIPRALLAGPSVLLCSEPTPDRCHRRLVLDYLRTKWEDVVPVHL